MATLPRDLKHSSTGDVLTQVLRGGLTMIGFGLAIGLIGVSR